MIMMISIMVVMISIVIMRIRIALTKIVTMIRAVEQFQGDRADHKKGVLPVIITVILMIRIMMIVITRYHHVQKLRHKKLLGLARNPNKTMWYTDPILSRW